MTDYDALAELALDLRAGADPNYVAEQIQDWIAAAKED